MSFYDEENPRRKVMRRLHNSILPHVLRGFRENSRVGQMPTIFVREGRPGANMFEVCCTLPNRPGFTTSSLITIEGARDPVVLEAAGHALGKETAQQLDVFDFGRFEGKEVIPDPSAHQWVDPSTGEVKRAGGTPKYVWRHGRGSLFKGMSDQDCALYDGLKGRINPFTGKLHTPVDDQQGGYKEDGAGPGGKSGTWGSERERQAKKKADKEAFEKAQKEAAEENIRLTREAYEAEKAAALRKKDDFYESQDDFGLF